LYFSKFNDSDHIALRYICSIRISRVAVCNIAELEEMVVHVRNGANWSNNCPTAGSYGHRTTGAAIVQLKTLMDIEQLEQQMSNGRLLWI
jgi:hypothetical protein